MTNIGGTHLGPGVVWTFLAVIVASDLFVSSLAAQPPRVRVNPIIDQFEQGLPAFANELSLIHICRCRRAI